MPEAMDSISISETDRGLVIAGELDAQSAPQLTALLASRPELTPFTVDLADVSFIDSSGLRAILEAHHERLADGRQLVIENPSTIVARLFDVAGVADYLSIDQR